MKKEKKPNDISIVPNDSKKLDKINKDLSVIKDIKICSVKGMIFIKTQTELSKSLVLKYLDKNAKIFKYAK